MEIKNWNRIKKIIDEKFDDLELDLDEIKGLAEMAKVWHRSFSDYSNRAEVDTYTIQKQMKEINMLMKQVEFYKASHEKLLNDYIKLGKKK
jgi:hypothetical protein